jgi:hypothetical protein
MSSGMNSQQLSQHWLHVAGAATARLLLALALALSYCLLTEHSGRQTSATTLPKTKQETFHVEEEPKGIR